MDGSAERDSVYGGIAISVNIDDVGGSFGE
jgi:hypothetical protein